MDIGKDPEGAPSDSGNQGGGKQGPSRLPQQGNAPNPSDDGSGNGHGEGRGQGHSLRPERSNLIYSNWQYEHRQSN